MKFNIYDFHYNLKFRYLITIYTNKKRRAFGKCTKRNPAFFADNFSKSKNMISKIKILSLFLLFLLLVAAECDTQKELPKQVEPSVSKSDTTQKGTQTILVGAERLDAFLSKLKNKNVALLVNQTSVTNNEHLVDVLLKNGISIKKIFAPEHGFRGQADAGEKVKDGKDAKTGIPLLSLYGKNKKPTSEHLSGIDLVVFDIQDVGARFYTYISSMSYVMEACAENNVDFMVLDRPNPNGHFIDGPILKEDYTSFVKCENYDHQTFYELPIKPSPNLPNLLSIYLYPSLCFFEGTTASIGRGTNNQFQVIGHPDFQQGDYNYTPVSMSGAKYPKHENKQCNGFDLTNLPLAEFQEQGQLNLNYLIQFYNNFTNKKSFFLENKFFDKLAGSATLRWQIINGKSEKEIRESWQKDLEAFQNIRKRYLLYKDFE